MCFFFFFFFFKEISVLFCLFGYSWLIMSC